LQHVIKLNDEAKKYGFFQQDGATTHTASNSIAVFSIILATEKISHPSWPDRSSDPTPCEYFLGESLKGNVCTNDSQKGWP
jgi:hypothetical protein